MKPTNKTLRQAIDTNDKQAMIEWITALNDLKRKELDGKVMVIRFYYACVIIALTVICILILIKT